MSAGSNNPPKALQFINVSNPEARKRASKHRPTIRSHVARVTHAAARQARTIEYQASRNAASSRRPIEIDQRDPDRDSESASYAVTETSSEWKSEAERAAIVAANSVPGVLGSAYRGDPFESFVTSLTPTDQFLLYHYVTGVVPQMHANCKRLISRGLVYLDTYSKEWIRLALGNTGFLSGILLNASRHLSMVHKQRDQQQLYANLAARFKLVSVRAVSEAISSDGERKSFSDPVVAVTMALAFDEISLGDMAMSRKHVQGAVQMVELNGGPQTLGLNGFLELVLHKYEGEVGLLDRLEPESRPCGGAFSPDLLE